MRKSWSVMHAGKYFTLFLGAFIALVPIVIVFFASLKDKQQFRESNKLQPPTDWLFFDNYVKAFVEGKMLIGFINTLFILFVAIAGTILIGAMISYVLSRFEFRGSRWIMAAFLLAALIPSVTTQVATFQVVNALGLFNTRGAAIVLYMGTDIISVYIFLQFLNGISKQLDESAMLDGASYLTIFFRIILPLLAPAIATVFIVKGVSIYNDFYIPFLYMPKEGLQMVSTTLFKFQGPYGAQWEVISAGVIIVIIPTLAAFLALQKYIYNGFTQGAEKG